jgi:hypothetical protein
MVGSFFLAAAARSLFTYHPAESATPPAGNRGSTLPHVQPASPCPTKARISASRQMVSLPRSAS